MIVTIDGPSGTGKSTLAKALAQTLQFLYCNTGAMYRTLAYARLQPDWQEVPLEDFLASPPFSFSFSKDSPLQAFYGDRLLTSELSSQEVANFASLFSKEPLVRAYMQTLQKQYATVGNCVFEGRDMGSKVFPHAEVKIFLTAKPEIRAERRLKDLPQGSLSKEALMAELIARDQADQQRECDPLVIPQDATVIDSSDLTISQILEKILPLIPSHLT
ncbi:(d)CMP kinase [Chlamydia trachomatis]|uniref:(d)CMP kinase n=1 Tax=Chlamydia trachomatis TaxID=813 RepID=UPI0002A7CDC3|nr:(d)CMP kinase [Chlamydia trachomatis]CCP54425.1 cytidylate kinase [Chlamydia trachomatis D/SotonD6]